ncbi:phage tail tape measure protein [Pseudoalteromonas piscicida]|uniref:phage tail tape measure protein n=1 Tax=Pseudoalteromonas piscicida TaxID=43662 RepID=UPI0027386BC1|nr:phage tail tape measure protein [Pseudoalteromonas piscicida]MDP4487265.1 phage tail tape measure protein [Pseudoalteromonas piscicida]
MSSLSKLDKLMYSIGVVDKVTGPVNKIMAKINQMSEQTAAAKEQMTGGLMSAAGGAMMLVGSLNPAIDAQAALGEVSSLNVSNEALTQLNNTAMNFVSNYGGNSAEVIRSSYDIQSAIAGLNGKELSQFTNSSAILAKGTKSDAATTTDYFGTMYGIYQDTAKEVGKSEWIQMLTGQTAASVRMFKTTGSEMAGAFSSLGASANSHGIEMNESMAVLGQLQATMSGSEAGTKYKAFLTGVGAAQQKLGIQLTDSQGKLLPMVQVIDRLKGRFGEIDTVAKTDALKNAFGSDEAVAMLQLLIPQTEQLESNINQLAQIKDMGVAVEMANSMSSSWDRFGGSMNAAMTSLGQAVLPIIEPIVDGLSAILRGVVWLTQTFPTLTGIIAAGVVAFTAYVVVMGAFNAVMGLYRMTMLSSIALTKAHLLITKLWQAALVALRIAGLITLVASLGAATVAMGALNAVMVAGKFAALLFSAALWANPITWIVAGVVALIAAIGALIYYWDDLVAAFKDTAWGQVLMSVFDRVKSSFDGLADSVGWILEKLGLIDDTEAKLKVEYTSQPLQEQLFKANPEQMMIAQRELGQTTITHQISKAESTAVLGQLQNTMSGANAGSSYRSFIESLPYAQQKLGIQLNGDKGTALPIVTMLERLQEKYGEIDSAKEYSELTQAFGSDGALVVKTLMPQADKLRNNIEQLAVGNNNKAAHVSMSGVTQLPIYNSDQNITNSAINSALEIERQKSELQQQNNTYKVKTHRSEFLQSLSKNTTNNQAVSTDNSKRVMIDSLTIKSDNVKRDFDELMELAG